MSETPTGTDRVELTEDERATLRGTWTRYDGQMGAIAPDVVFAAVQSIVADRTTQLRKAYETVNAENEETAAELAAANARCAELEGTYWHEELGKVLIKNKALQATLDRVTALADEWNRDKPPRTASVFGRALRSAISGDGA